MSAAAVARALSPVVPKAAEAAAGQDEEARWRPALGLPCQLTVDLALPNFKVSDFLALRKGSVLGSGWRVADDIPLRINGTLIGWAEFEGGGGKFGVRLTDLA